MLFIMFDHSHAYSATYATCQASCAATATACYAANGARFGAVRSVDASPALLRCNTALGACQTFCASVERLGQQMNVMSLGALTSDGGVLDSLANELAKMNIK